MYFYCWFYGIFILFLPLARQRYNERRPLKFEFEIVSIHVIHLSSYKNSDFVWISHFCCFKELRVLVISSIFARLINWFAFWYFETLFGRFEKKKYTNFIYNRILKSFLIGINMNLYKISSSIFPLTLLSKDSKINIFKCGNSYKNI